MTALEQGLASGKVDALRPHMTAFCHALRNHDDIAIARRDFLDDDRVRALRNDAAGENAHRLACADRAVERAAGRHFADHAQARRSLRDIRRPNGIAIHGGEVGWRLGAQRGEILRQDAPIRFGERRLLRWQGRGVGEHARQRVSDGERRHVQGSAGRQGSRMADQPSCARKWPDLPPRFSIRRTPWMRQPALDRLDHVIDGEAGDRDRSERLHLDARLPRDLHGRVHAQAAGVRPDRAFDHALHEQRAAVGVPRDALTPLADARFGHRPQRRAVQPEDLQQPVVVKDGRPSGGSIRSSP